MTEVWGLAPPAFHADEALAGLKRSLRELGLVEREGRFERKTIAVARAVVQGDAIAAARVKRPSRSSPQWQERRLTNSAQVRDFVADLKKQLALWSDLDD